MVNGPVAMDGMNKTPDLGGGGKHESVSINKVPTGNDVGGDDSNNEVSYVGETSRPLRERVWEHTQNLKNGNPKSFIITHWMEAHEDTIEAPEFEWKVLDAYPDALRRQLGEGLHILESGALNKKLEFNNNLICRMEVAKNNMLTDKDLQQELTKRRAHASRLTEFIQKKASTTDVILLK